MKKSGILFNILLYASLIFLLYFLWRFDYLSLRDIHFNIVWLAISVGLLWAGFVFSTISWRYALKFHDININNRTAVVSHGLAIFAKYIPGKVWVILGRASYVTRFGHNIRETSFISLKEQLLYILLGLIISAIPTFWYLKWNYISIVLFLTCIGLSLVLFNGRFHRLTENFLAWLFRKEFSLPKLNFTLSAKLSLYILVYWAFWTLAFFFLSKAILPTVSPIYAFAFPLSVCYGVMAIVMPGGLGVREGILVAFLVVTGVNTELAISLSVVARLWYVSGEVFLFILALILKRK